MGIDRGATVKKAEDLVREGKPQLAIEAYLRLVAEQPGDVGAANALGDLYVKVGNRALAVAQFVRIGDSHRDSGFIPKAVAFYKKALKVDPASDHALSQLAQIAIDQELYADATLYLNRLLQRRREQGNEAGVAECLVRLGGFPAADASRLWVEAADALERAGRLQEALDVLMQAASLDTGDIALQRRIAIACADSGDMTVSTFEGVADTPDATAPEAWRAAAASEGEPEPVGEPGWEDALLEDDGGAELDTAPAISADFGAQALAAVASGAPDPPAATITATELEWSALLGADVRAGDGAGMGVNDDGGFVVDDGPAEETVSEVSELSPASGPEPEPAEPAEADTSTIAALTTAAENPALQFQASAQLGRLLLRFDRGREGVAWLERAAQATAAVREQRLDVTYELADALEQIGELTRALDVFADLDDAASYRDVPERMARLRRALEERRAP